MSKTRGTRAAGTRAKGAETVVAMRTAALLMKYRRELLPENTGS
jgi:hypothetical protein